MLKFGRLVQYGSSEAADWSQSTFGQIQDGRMAHKFEFMIFLHFLEGRGLSVAKLQGNNQIAASRLLYDAGDWTEVVTRCAHAGCSVG